MVAKEFHQASTLENLFSGNSSQKEIIYLTKIASSRGFIKIHRYKVVV